MVNAVVECVDASHEMRQDFRAEIDRFFPEAREQIHDRRGHHVYGAIGQVPGRVFHFFMKRPDDAAFVEFDDPAFFGLSRIEGHHRYFDALLPFLVPPDEGSDVEAGQVVRVNEHRRFTLEEVPVFKERPARPQQALFVHRGYSYRMSAAFDIGSNRLREVMKVDQDFDDAALAQQLDPVVEERPAVYLDKTLGYGIRYRTQTRTKPGGKEQRTQCSALHGVVALAHLDKQ